MSASKKLCFGKRIKRWFSNLGLENRIILITITALGSFTLHIYLFSRFIFYGYLAELTAAFLSVVIAFNLSRYIDAWKDEQKLAS